MKIFLSFITLTSQLHQGYGWLWTYEKINVKKVFVKTFNWYFQNTVRNFQLVEKIPWDLLIRVPSVVSTIYIYIGFYTTLTTLKNMMQINYPILCFMVIWNWWRRNLIEHSRIFHHDQHVCVIILGKYIYMNSWITDGTITSSKVILILCPTNSKRQ